MHHIIQPIATIILGFIFYDDFPDIYTLIGSLVIVVSGVYVFNNKLPNSEK